MKMVTIEVVVKPQSFSGLGFDAKDYAAAVKAGPKTVPYGTGLEAIENSKGLYQFRPEKDPVEVKVIAAKDPSEMTKEELVAEMTAFGKAPQKQMPRSKCEEFIREMRVKAAEMILDDKDE